MKYSILLTSNLQAFSKSILLTDDAFRANLQYAIVMTILIITNDVFQFKTTSQVIALSLPLCLSPFLLLFLWQSCAECAAALRAHKTSLAVFQFSTRLAQLAQRISQAFKLMTLHLRTHREQTEREREKGVLCVNRIDINQENYRHGSQDQAGDVAATSADYGQRF